MLLLETVTGTAGALLPYCVVFELNVDDFGILLPLKFELVFEAWFGLLELRLDDFEFLMLNCLAA